MKNTTNQAIRDEKRLIFAQLKAYRQKHGVGCFKKISEATGGKIAVHTIAHMLQATRIGDDVWQEVGHALAKLRED